MSERIRDAAQGFDQNADAYEAARPSYPAEAVAHIVGHGGIGPGGRVLDLAAGTGKLTRLLVPTGAEVVAVEPVAGMRERLAASLPDIEVHDGTAEALPLSDGSFDAVTVAQAFHWFDPGVALAEIAPGATSRWPPLPRVEHARSQPRLGAAVRRPAGRRARRRAAVRQLLRRRLRGPGRRGGRVHARRAVDARVGAAVRPRPARRPGRVGQRRRRPSRRPTSSGSSIGSATWPTRIPTWPGATGSRSPTPPACTAAGGGDILLGMTDPRVAPAAARFGDTADLYERARPGYPEDLLDALAARRGARVRHRRSSISGPARASSPASSSPSAPTVTAVEPTAGMREQLGAAVPGARVLDGTAEDVPLGDATADVVTVAQAFHWFRHRGRPRRARAGAAARADGWRCCGTSRPRPGGPPSCGTCATT